ncbi:uncharacterized protein TRAVEDRAFT_54810 [Trametes versicolor FP-101664 SS1]|uniref:Uncharacterized protein n=1 Tax=Trametes versicolor (strain FP-101664) TaxID=717944 RepID=R7S8A1_TRAVS|nr:uncharacterized protein TRAVEDRAFT_54810 [Trametes versicolor FP-101664 SS1]EIW51179.1 hypothetical protein TRAVEDRAFT_54810 [Trametes versicolor FP-101664 SS1]
MSHPTEPDALQQACMALDAYDLAQLPPTPTWGAQRDAHSVNSERADYPWGEPEHLPFPQVEVLTLNEPTPEGKVRFQVVTRQPVEGLLKCNGDNDVNVDLHLLVRGETGGLRSTSIEFPRSLAEVRGARDETWLEEFERVLDWFPEMDAEQRQVLLETVYIYDWFHRAEMNDELGIVWRDFQGARTSALLGSWFSPVRAEEILSWLIEWAQTRIPSTFPVQADGSVQSSDVADTDDIALGEQVPRAQDGH